MWEARKLGDGVVRLKGACWDDKGLVVVCTHNRPHPPDLEMISHAVSKLDCDFAIVTAVEGDSFIYLASLDAARELARAIVEAVQLMEK